MSGVRGLGHTRDEGVRQRCDERGSVKCDGSERREGEKTDREGWHSNGGIKEASQCNGGGGV